MKKLMLGIIAFWICLNLTSVFGNLYIGANVGKQVFKQNKLLTHVNDKYAGRFDLGYNFNSNIGVEAGLVLNTESLKFVKKNDPEDCLTFRQTIVDAFGVASLTSDKLTLSGKVGVAEILNGFIDKHHSNFNYDLTNVFTPAYGLALNYQLVNSLLLNVQAIHYMPAKNFNGLNYAGIGLVYKFNIPKIT